MNIMNIIDSLNDLGYSKESGSPIDNPDLLKTVVENNIIEYSKIVSYLTTKLSFLLNLDEKVNSIENSSEQTTFNLEICSFLKELPCPYKLLTVGIIDERYKSYQNKLDLLDFLTSELQAAKIISINKPEITPTITRQKSSETEEEKSLKKILVTLGFPKPPANITATEIWSRVENKCKQLISQLPKGYLGSPLLNALLSNEQWEKLMQINQILCDDFRLRRELLLTRLDVTIQSFKWADRLKKNNNEIADLYQQRRKELSVKQSVKIYDILAARDDLLKQEKTCSTRLMCKSQLHKIIIPKVPDRGGRTTEMEAPPPEMPKFMQRKTTANPQAQRPNKDGGGRGGQHHDKSSGSNWNQPQSDFEKFQNQDYHGGGGRGGSGYRGGRGRGGGNRN